ncbi:ribosome small subunit-dependent GTPase A [Paenibacillus lautus]|uniref:Small ribosomal subunit biogenesis GTPase RsgA n=2 Tax=Paenibacillus TaxID=44249 RepID=A0A1R1B700_PAELA|nr:ribosome small subunit-dependent GTPase A [Paenibacillus lautus]
MMNLKDYGFPAQNYSIDTEGTYARVTAVHKGSYSLVTEYGECSARLKSSVYFNNCTEEFPTTGDFVEIQYNTEGESLIIKTLKRKSKFARNDLSGHGSEYVKTIKEQTVAANFDYVFIMQSLNHDLNLKRLERYLTLSWQSGAVPVVVLTKSDLIEDYSAQLNSVKQIAIGVDVHAISAKTGYGIDGLADYLKKGKTVVFLGSSGAGKSSLVNALAGQKVMSVKEIREDDSKGRHTTTHRQLIRLDSGVMVIDTPGMRELGMWNVSEGLRESFSDVKQFLGRCKFSDCKHQSEPGCAIKMAIEDGNLAYERWESYLTLKKEAAFVDDKATYLRSKDHQQVTMKVWERQKSKETRRTNDKH